MKKKKKSVVNSKNTVTFIITLAICLIIVVAIVCNALNKYFDNKDLKQKAGNRPSFYASENTKMDILIPDSGMDEEINDIEFKVSLQNNDENGKSVCKYNLYYYWEENPYGYFKTSSEDEITLTGTLDGKVIFKDIALNDYNLGDLKTLLSSYYIVSEGTRITNQTWDIKAYYHANDNQEKIINENFPGEVGVQNVVCSEAHFLKDEEITPLNNYICLNSRDEFCPEDKLYQVLDITNEGIKVVRVKPFGVSSWNSDLLPRLEEAFLNSDGKYLRGMINNHEWSLKDENNSNFVNVNSKIGLLSIDDYNTLKDLDNYDKPYLLLSETGLVVKDNNYVHENISTGYIYPVFYLNNDAVVSTGEGVWGNPYFVN